MKVILHLFVFVLLLMMGFVRSDVVWSGESIPRPEHPRPDKYRSTWQNLNGSWEFAFDPENHGAIENWQDRKILSKQFINVPFAPESLLSGIHDEEFHSYCWYARNFDVPKSLMNQRLLLHFGAVDYRAEVWLNGKKLGEHRGGYDAFSFDVTDIIREKGNRLVLRVEDDPAGIKPKGKQSPDRHPSICLYMRVTGIWQTVWLESVGNSYIDDWFVTANPQTGLVRLRVETKEAVAGLTLRTSLTFHGCASAEAQTTLNDKGVGELSFSVTDPVAWSPETPTLYDMTLQLIDAEQKTVDSVSTYIGFRSVHVANGQYYLNNKPLFFMSALDQGYNIQGLYTPPTDAFQREDVLWAKRYGLNGIRKHQIMPEPRFYYWCDVLGLLVWSEMPDWGIDMSAESGRSANDIHQSMISFFDEWSRCLKQNINHPSIITWVVTNEMKYPHEKEIGQFKLANYERTKKLDPTRPVIDNSGYSHTKTDITDLHANPKGKAPWQDWSTAWRKSIATTGNFDVWENCPTYDDGFRYRGEPVLISETGNWRIETLPPNGPWPAYGAGPFANVDDYLKGYRAYFTSLISEPLLSGFSYVQLYDVEGEVNGYLTYDRKPKVDPEQIRAVHAEGLKLRREKMSGK